MTPCPCKVHHAPRRIVLTGGPGSGKTAVLELVRQSFCEHLRVLPESASMLFAGGFPRVRTNDEVRRASQRAIFHVQRELEIACAAEDDHAVLLCDRGTVDGVAYWPGPGDYFSAVGTIREAEIRKYDAVVHLRTPEPSSGYNRQNPMRIETAEEARVIDDRLLEVWRDHPRRFVVESRESFLDKAREALAILREEMPACCRNHTGATRVEALPTQGQPC